MDTGLIKSEVDLSIAQIILLFYIYYFMFLGSKV